MKQIVYSACICILIINGMSNKRQISKYEDYESKCEALLDSIATWDNSFLDTIEETNVYREYVISKEKLDNSKLNPPQRIGKLLKNMRKKFNSARICSSDNYEASRRVYMEYLRKFHNENIVEIRQITESITVKKKCYVSCFGHLIEITEAEEVRIEKSVKIIRK